MLGVLQQQQQNATVTPATILDIPASEASLTFTNTGTTSGNNQIWEVLVSWIGTNGAYVGGQQLNGLKSTDSNGTQTDVPFDSYDGVLTNRHLFSLPPSASDLTYSFDWGIIADGPLQASGTFTFPAHSTTGSVTAPNIGLPRLAPSLVGGMGYGLNSSNPPPYSNLPTPQNPAQFASSLVSGATLLPDYSGWANQPVELNGVANFRIIGHAARGQGIGFHTIGLSESVIQFGGASQVRISGIRAAVGSGPTGNYDPFRNEGGAGSTILVDNCHLFAGRDQIMSVWFGSTDIVFYRCILGPTQRVFDSNGNEVDTSRGPIVGGGSTRVAFVQSLFGGNKQRNPRLRNSGDFATIDCVIAGWFGSLLSEVTSADGDFEGNVYIHGSDSSISGSNGYIKNGGTVYLDGNTTDVSGYSPSLNQASMVANNGGSISSTRLTSHNVTRLAFADVLPTVFANVGVRPNNPDSKQLDIITRAQNGTLSRDNSFLQVSDLPTLAGGPTRIDTSRADRTSAAFRQAVGMADTDDARLIDDGNGNGVVMMEQFFHWLGQAA